MFRSKHRFNGVDMLHKLAALPYEAAQWMKNKSHTVMHEKKLLDSAHRITVDEALTEKLRRRLDWIAKMPGTEAGAAGGPGSPLKPDEEALIACISRERDAHNLNNVSRTAAYLHMYREHPELHWAFLAHMVSRNGGWNMTDLKGEYLPYLLSEQDAEHVFVMLERANSLIFHDVYPQLLLYRASLHAGKSLFHLLSAFGVSRFMRPVWELFWESKPRASSLLTISLIVNEQSYIEDRVIRSPYYRRHVLDRFFFQAQSLLQLNQVVFPYRDGGRTRLAGLILENFSSVRERIELGKKMYAILFGIPVVMEGCSAFAFAQRHTGSRADYWPQLFAPVRKDRPVPRGELQEKLDGLKLRPGAAPLFSPRLEHVWANRKMLPPEPGDWFADSGAVDYIREIKAPFAFEMTHEFGFGLSKIEMTVLAGDLLK